MVGRRFTAPNCAFVVFLPQLAYLLPADTAPAPPTAAAVFYSGASNPGKASA
jgi:hypothetical protein